MHVPIFILLFYNYYYYYCYIFSQIAKQIKFIIFLKINFAIFKSNLQYFIKYNGRRVPPKKKKLKRFYLTEKR